MESAFAEKFCRRLNDGRPDSSIATISPSMIVPSGSFANAAAMWGKRLSNRFAIELGQPNSFVLLVPVYVRGEAYLALGDGQRAAAEFQKFIDHRGVVANFSWAHWPGWDSPAPTPCKATPSKPALHIRIS